MDRVKLTPRLLTAAQLAGDCRFAVDVGTDHGRLAVWLLQNGAAERVAATDIRRGPLSSAMATAREYGNNNFYYIPDTKLEGNIDLHRGAAEPYIEFPAKATGNVEKAARGK